MSDDAYKTAKRVTALGTAIVMVLTGVGFINKHFIADPIVRAVSEERIARQSGDSSMVLKLNAIQSGQKDLTQAIGDATYSKTEIDKFRVDADREHANLQKQIDQLRLIVGPRFKMPDMD